MKDDQDRRDQNTQADSKEQARSSAQEALDLLASMEQEEQQWKDLIYPEETEKGHKAKKTRRSEKGRRNRGRKKGQSSEERRRTLRWRVLLFLLLLLAGALGYLYVRFAPTKEHMDLREYYLTMLPEESGITEFAEDERALVLETEVADGKGRVFEDGLYLDYEVARANLNSRFFWDEENALCLYTTAYETYEIPVNSAVYTVDGEEKSFSRPILLQDERGLYLSAEFMQEYTNMEYHLTEAGVMLHYQWGERLTASVTGESEVRVTPSWKGLILTTAAQGDTVRVLDQQEKWTRVVTEDGCIGYLPGRRLTQPQETEVTREFQEQEYPTLAGEEKINLVWHMIGSQEANDYLTSDIEGMTGVNVISPTWFSLSDNEGNFTSYASKRYVRRAHRAGLQVWGLVSNFSPDMSTAELLSHTAARRALVKNLVDAALECAMDGINVDLETIAESAGYAYVQFVRELSIECRKNELVLSVDVPVPMPFSMHYDRGELAKVADYVILMGYDEHYAGSEAGSVASLSFEENGITETLKEADSAAVISGVPFYTRMWYSQTDESGNESVWSETLGMNAVSRTLETYGVEPVWDEATGQYLAQWTLEDGIECRIWMEEETSLALKADLVKTYQLGGIAAWALGFEREEIWAVISEHIA